MSPGAWRDLIGILVGVTGVIGSFTVVFQPNGVLRIVALAVTVACVITCYVMGFQNLRGKR